MRALTQVQAVVLKAGALDWVLERDPMLRTEMESAVLRRHREFSDAAEGGAARTGPVICIPFLPPIQLPAFFAAGPGGAGAPILCGADAAVHGTGRAIAGFFDGLSRHDWGLQHGGKPQRQRSLHAPTGKDSSRSLGGEAVPQGPPTPPPTLTGGSGARRYAPAAGGPNPGYIRRASGSRS